MHSYIARLVNGPKLVAGLHMRYYRYTTEILHNSHNKVLLFEFSLLVKSNTAEKIVPSHKHAQNVYALKVYTTPEYCTYL